MLSTEGIDLYENLCIGGKDDLVLDSLRSKRSEFPAQGSNLASILNLDGLSVWKLRQAMNRNYLFWVFQFR